MISLPTLLSEMFAWIAADIEGQSLVATTTGLSSGGKTLYRLEFQTAGTGALDLIVTDGNEVVVDEVTGNVVWEG